jgi:predicted ribosomally synthesized peptide with SipW-like signal peptide
MLKSRSIALLLVLSLVAFSLIIGLGTFALFTSQATSDTNQFTAGTLSIDAVEGYDRINGPMFYTSTSHSGSIPYDVETLEAYGGEALGGWAPGDTVTRFMEVENTGSLDAILKGLRAHVNAAGLQPGHDAYEQFVRLMNITVTEGSEDGRVLYDGSLQDLVLSGDVWHDIEPPVAVNVDDVPVLLYFTASLDLSADNELQGHDFVFDFELYAEQKRNNSDLPEGDISIVLSWERLADLDAHLTGPTDSGGRFHVFWGNRTYSEGDFRATLDGDSWTYGPETITIENIRDQGTYRYYVTNQSIARPRFQDVKPTVHVYIGDELVATFEAPSGNGRTWYVFDIESGSSIVPVNLLYQNIVIPSSAGEGDSAQSDLRKVEEAMNEKGFRDAE